MRIQFLNIVQLYLRANAVFAGGRYDNLIENMEAAQLQLLVLPAWVERMFELIEMNEQNIINIIVLPLSDAEKSSAFSLLNLLRQNDIKADIIFSGGNLTKSLKKQLNLSLIL